MTRKRSLETSPVPDDFEITDKMREWFYSNGVDRYTNIELETDQFLDTNRAKGNEYLDWQAAWRTWMRNAVKFGLQRKEGTGYARPANKRQGGGERQAAGGDEGRARQADKRSEFGVGTDFNADHD